MTMDHLPALQVVIPLLAAPVCFLLGRWPRLAWLLASAVAWTTLVIAVGLWLQVREGGTLSYAFGGWAPPWGIEYAVDRLNVLVLLIVSGIAAVIFSGSRESVGQEIPESRQALLFTNLLLCLAGLLGITITGDAFNLFVLLEISSLSTYALISLGRDRRALTASFQYLIMGYHRRHLHPDRRGHPLHAHRHPQHGGPRPPPGRNAGFPGHAHGLRLPRHRHRSEAGDVSPAPVAAQRLCLRAVGGLRLHRGHRHQGGGIRHGAIPVHHLRTRIRLFRDVRAVAVHPRRDYRGTVHIHRGAVPARHQAHAGLFLRGPDRLHAGGDRTGQRHRPDRRPAARVQSRPDERRPCSWPWPPCASASAIPGSRTSGDLRTRCHGPWRPLSAAASAWSACH